MKTYGEIMSAFDEVTRDSSRYYFTQAQVDRFATRAVTELCERCRYKDAYAEIDSVAGTGEYAIGVSAYDIYRVEYNDEVLWPIAKGQLRTCGNDWSTRTGLPRYFYLDEIYSLQSASAIGLYEIPSTSLTDGIRVWYHAMPAAPIGTSLLSRAVQVDVPDWAVGAVLYYMLYLAYTADTKIKNFDTAGFYKMLYEDIAERLAIRSNDRQPKRWVSGASSRPNINVLNRLPQRITE